MHVIRKFFGPNYFFWSALKVPPSDFIKNMSQAPSKCLKQRIKVDKLDYFKNLYIILKILFVLCADECLERLDGKIRKFFYVKIVCWTYTKMDMSCLEHLHTSSSTWSLMPLVVLHHFLNFLFKIHLSDQRIAIYISPFRFSYRNQIEKQICKNNLACPKRFRWNVIVRD